MDTARVPLDGFTLALDSINDAMRVQYKTNHEAAIGGLAKPPGASLTSTVNTGYGNTQELVLTVVAEVRDDDVHQLGFTQTLQVSKRKAFYEDLLDGLATKPIAGADLSVEMGTLEIFPTIEAPVLDGQEMLQPWYAPTSMGPEISKIKTNNGLIEFEINMSDTPQFYCPNKAVDPNGMTQDLKAVYVEEEFLLSLIDKTTNEIYEQWVWSYNYRINFAPELKPPNPRFPNLPQVTFLKPTVGSRTEVKATVQRPPNKNIKMAKDDPVANTAANKSWKANWAPVHADIDQFGRTMGFAPTRIVVPTAPVVENTKTKRRVRRS